MPESTPWVRAEPNQTVKAYTDDPFKIQVGFQLTSIDPFNITSIHAEKILEDGGTQPATGFRKGRDLVNLSRSPYATLEVVGVCFSEPGIFQMVICIEHMSEGDAVKQVVRVREHPGIVEKDDGNKESE